MRVQLSTTNAQRICATAIAATQRPQIPASMLILAVSLLTASAVVAPAWRIGKRCEDHREFLRSYRAPSDLEAYLALSAAYAADSHEANEVVFIGTSTCFAGIDTREFQRQTGLIAYNCAAPGVIGIEGTAALVKIYLAHHPPPRVFVFCNHPSEFGNTPYHEAAGRGTQSVPERFLWCYGCDQAYPRPSAHAPTQYFVSQGILIGAGNLRGGRQRALNTPIWGSGPTYEQLQRQVDKDRGFFPLSADAVLPPGTKAAPPRNPAHPTDGVPAAGSYPVMPEYAAGLRRIAAMAAGVGALLMIRTSPDLPGGEVENCEQLRVLFDQLERDYPNVVCDRPEVLRYGPRYFGDHKGHLNLNGVKKFTTFVAAEVKRLLMIGTADNAAGRADRLR